jgi:pimeloyl-ACP methyl ester carboxylesterase
MIAILGFVVFGAACAFPGYEPRGCDDNPIVVRVPLTDAGDLSLGTFVEVLARSTDVPVAVPDTVLTLPVRGVAGGLTLRALEEALGPGVDLSVQADSVVATLDRTVHAPEGRSAWRTRLDALAARVKRDAALDRQLYGMKALRSYHPNDSARPTVLLIHGMNSNSGGFVHMVPLLEEAGYGVVVYDFPDNQDLDRSSPAFVRDWMEFRRRAQDKRPWSVVGHSMGCLLARWYVEGKDFAGDVSDLILIGPPNHGTVLARAQTLLQFIRGLQLLGQDEAGAMSTLGEGLGEAADDLLPKSDFLRRLNSEPRREGVRYRILAGNRGWLSAERRREIEGRIEGSARAAGVFGKLARLAVPDLSAQLDALTDGTGDGVVPLASTQLAGVDAPTVIPANHVELIRGPLLYPDPGPVACMPQLLEWLPRPAPAAP